MARRTSLQPRPTGLAKWSWYVNLPANISSTGKRQRHFFKTKQEAATFAQTERVRLENFGRNSSTLTPGQQEEAAIAFEKLSPYSASLNTVVADYIARHEARARSVTFKTMFERFIEAKKGKRSDAYLTALRCTLPRFAALHGRRACDISTSEIEEQLKGASASVHNAFLRYLRAVFNFAIRRGWCTDNPVKRIDMHSLKMRKEILANPQVMALLKAVCEMYFELLPYHVLCIFAGIRPKETERLSWGNINLSERFIEVPEEKSKTGIRRIVEIEPLLLRWLDYFIRAGGKTDGSVTPTSNLRKRLRAVRKAAGIEQWPQDAPRRTFASCWLAIHSDVNRLNNLMGHTSPAMLWRHYHKAVTRKNAETFWSISPPDLDEKKIIPIATKSATM